MGGARQPTRSGFSETIPSFNVEDSALSRLTNNLKSALQPVLSIFSGSPDSAKIYWGKGVPTVALVPGSIYIQTDASTTAASTMFVKRLGTTSPNWSTIPNGFGNLIYQSKDNETLNTSPSTWAFADSGPINGPTIMAASGSIQAAAFCVYNNDTGAQIPIPKTLSAGSIDAQMYINGVATGGIINLASGSPLSTVFRYAIPGTIKYNAGDIVSISTKGNAAAVGTGKAAIVCTMWGG